MIAIPWVWYDRAHRPKHCDLIVYEDKTWEAVGGWDAAHGFPPPSCKLRIVHADDVKMNDYKGDLSPYG
jgi:hypothetical protein